MKMRSIFKHLPSVDLDLVISGLVATILLISALDKAAHYTGFVQALKSYVLLPANSAGWIAPVVVLVELFLGICLLVPASRSLAGLVSAGLFILFSIILSTNHVLGGKGICGCWFTITLAQGTYSHIALNLLLALLAVFVWRSGPHSALRHQERTLAR